MRRTAPSALRRANRAFAPFAFFVAKTHPTHTTTKTFFARPLVPRSGIWYTTRRALRWVHIQPHGSANAERGSGPKGPGP